jgi:colanic acid/amylovoran biosynthesis glycosyltransferase
VPGRPKVAYIVSRFPHVSETFIVRELNAVSAAGIEIELFSLFAPVDPTVHSSAAAWIPNLHSGRLARGLAAFGWWMLRRPLRLLASGASVCAAYARRPDLALRALATLVIACDHARTLRERPVDHVHAHYATYPALAAWLCRQLAGTPYSFTAHAHDLFVDASMLRRKVADAAFVVTISEFNRRWIAAHAPAATPIHVVRAGIDPGAYAFRLRSLEPGTPVEALCVASLQEYKGHAVLLRALASDPRLERVRLELIGGGELRRELERLAAELGLARRVTFAGARDEEAVRDRLEAADLFVLASVVAADGQMEGVPVALMEALACGIPTVATRLSGIPELVVDDRTGLLAAPGDPAALAEAITRTLADPVAARRRSTAGRTLVEEEFDLRRSGARMAALFVRSTG